jgi:AraC-like DNA-binding protein
MMTSDVLSDVLRSVRLTGAVYFDFSMSSPWVAAAPPTRDLVGRVLPGAERIIMYHLVARGACWARLDGQPPIRLNEGDLVVYPQGDSHVLSSAPGMHAVPDLSAFADPSTPLPMVYRMGGGGAETARLICGFLGCDERPYNPLLSALPQVIHLRATETRGGATWPSTLIRMAAAESGRQTAGGGNVRARLAELMFVEVVRRYLETLPPAQRGWLAGLRDPMVGKALAAMHEDPTAAWTVESLARHVGASRSAFAERFTQMVGQPPMQYLALWRMQRATHLLVEGRGVADVADSVGYESEAAFSRAFKKLIGEAPASWRRRATLVGLPVPA